MERATKVTILILCIVVFIAIFSKCRQKSIESKPNKVDSIIELNDSLQHSLDSIDIKIDSINDWYEKACSIIDNQSVDDDIDFFSKYLSKTNK